ncbi:hypothetical protein [Nostoc sp.]|uniref:hypothetical protein n=1 Tax=Nostoc sp. TaxID=1180 RepID=UPI002FFA8BF8
MSDTVNIFVHLLRTNPSLFSQEDRDELVKLIDKQPDENQSLLNAISDWLSEHPEIEEALAEFEEIGEKAPGDEQTNTSIPKDKFDKNSLTNEIQPSSSSAKEVEKRTRNN